MTKQFFIGILITGLIMIIGKISAQDVHFSQFQMSPQLMSPAMCGANYDVEANANYKDQWRSVGSPYKTLNAAYSMRINPKRNKSGFLVAGVNFYNDKAGDSNMKTSFIDATIGYHVFLSQRSMLGAAVQGGYGQRSVDYTALMWGEQYNGTSYDPSMSTGETQAGNAFGYPDLGAGLVYSFKENTRYVNQENPLSINVGVGAYHLLKPDYNFNSMSEQLYRKYTGFISASWQMVNSKIGFEPGVFYSRQGPNQEIFGGTYVTYLLQQSSRVTGYVKGSKVGVAMFYRAMDAFVTGVRYDFGNFSVGFTYDFNVSRLTPASNGRGGMEITLRYVSPNPFSYSSHKSMF